MNLPIDKAPATDPAPDHTDRRHRARQAWDDKLRRALELDGHSAGIPESWFLGPHAENLDLLKGLVAEALDSHAAFRRDFHPEDPTHLTPAIRNSHAFGHGTEELQTHARKLMRMLRLSAPFASMRYQGHMLWDQAIPATVGTIAAVLYNQNNVAAEASPVTTRLEIEAANDLCRMLGYDVPEYGEAPLPGTVAPWGHITCGGTVANIEAMWAARNLKFFPVGLRAALREVPQLAPARNIEVPLWDGSSARLVDLDTWTLLNLDGDAVGELPAAVADAGVTPDELFEALSAYSLRNIGFVSFYGQFMNGVSAPPVFLTPATAHYSWPKAATLLGLGQNAVLVQRVDRDARLDLEHVETTLNSLLRRRVPLLAAVAVIGSTEESAVDPLDGLLEMRERYRKRGLNFAIHADAAWGGYFRSMLRPAPEPDKAAQVPVSAMSSYVEAQYRALPQADSITVDPHKGGYIPYPAGALCYRNAAWRDTLSLRAPVVFHSQTEPTVGIYGVEGSKPGAAAAAVWLAHRVIRPDKSGYGRILGQCMWTSKRLFCRLATLQDERFTVTMFNRTPAERAYLDSAEERALLRSTVGMSNHDLEARLAGDAALRPLFKDIGSDQVILSFMVNFRDRDGQLNRDLERANAFNDRVFSLCSLIEPREHWGGLDLLLTSSRFDISAYGRYFVDALCRRMGVEPKGDLGIDFLISTAMDPWPTDTDGGDFLQVLEDALRRAAHQALDAMGV